jgi:hypothetical protein
VPLPAPPLSDSVPSLVIVLFRSTLRSGNEMAVLWTALTDAPATTSIVTPVLPGAATTGVLLLPEHVTVVLLAGAVFVHCAAAGEVKAANSNKKVAAAATEWRLRSRAIAKCLTMAPHTLRCQPQRVTDVRNEILGAAIHAGKHSWAGSLGCAQDLPRAVANAPQTGQASI